MLPGVVVFRILFAFLCSLAPLCSAQALAASSPSFAVATIKASDPNITGDRSSIGFNPGGSFDATSMSLKQLVEFVQSFGYIDVDVIVVDSAELPTPN
jgi:hypothetical protein